MKENANPQYLDLLCELLHGLLHPSKLSIHALPHLLQGVSHLREETQTPSSPQPPPEPLMRRPRLTPAHLSDVFHLVLKVAGRPLPRHHLLLSVSAHPLHDAVHFGPAMLQRGVRHPIGHVPEVLREDKPSGQVSVNSLGRAPPPPLSLFNRRQVFVCARVHGVCTDANGCIFTLDQVFPAAEPLGCSGSGRLGTCLFKKIKCTVF